MVWQGAEPEAGFHQLAAAGPWPNAGTLQAKHGRLVWQWQCGRCQAKASDSSRALALLRKPCRGAGPTCSRCDLVCSIGRSVEAAGQACPVMACTRHGAAWPEGESSLAKELGKLHGFRRWCEAPSVVMRPINPLQEGGPPPDQPPGAGGMPVGPGDPLRPFRLHLACKLGRRWLCLNCFQMESGGVAAFRRARCEGAAPIADLPKALCALIVRYGAGAGLAGAAGARADALWAESGVPAAVLHCPVQPAAPLRIQETAIGKALARGHRPGGGTESAPPDSPGPLAAAADAADRRVLKRRKTGVAAGDDLATSSGAAEARRVCRIGLVSSAVAAWPPWSGVSGPFGGGGSRRPVGHSEPTSLLGAGTAASSGQW